MYIWTPASLAFRQDAEAFFHIGEKIALQVIPLLSPDAYVCDVGCGLGYTALTLARHGYRTVAVDSDPHVLEILRSNREAAGIDGPEILREDIFSLHPKEFYTDMIFSFFGNTDAIFQIARQQCKGTIHILRKSWSSRRFSTEEEPMERCSLQDMLEELDKKEIPYRESGFALEMGQPFRSAEDAAAFFMIYGQEEQVLRPEDVMEHLTETGDPVFPYCLPSPQQLKLISLQVDQLRKNY